jgi:hypothetical protein
MVCEIKRLKKYKNYLQNVDRICMETIKNEGVKVKNN